MACKLAGIFNFNLFVFQSNFSLFLVFFTRILWSKFYGCKRKVLLIQNSCRLSVRSWDQFFIFFFLYFPLNQVFGLFTHFEKRQERNKFVCISSASNERVTFSFSSSPSLAKALYVYVNLNYEYLLWVWQINEFAQC